MPVFKLVVAVFLSGLGFLFNYKKEFNNSITCFVGSMIVCCLV